MKRTILGIFLSLTSSLTIAAEYRWQYMLGGLIGNFTSPYYACAAAVSATWFNGKKELIDVVFTSPSKTSARCHVRLSRCSGNQCGEWYTPEPPHSIDGHYVNAIRDGQTCKVTGVLDSDLGICVDLAIGQQAGGGDSSCKITNSGPGVYAGNPINFASANKYEWINLYQANRGRLEFSLHYNSARLLWSNSYSEHLTEFSLRTYVTLADGRIIAFMGTSGRMASKETADILQKGVGEWTLFRETGEVLHFDNYGQLKKIVWLDDELVVTRTHTPMTTTVTSRYGESITFVRGGNGNLVSLQAPQVNATFEYYTDKITKIRKAVGGTASNMTLHYEGTHRGLLTGITDERGVRYVTWAYDEQNRPILSDSSIEGGATQIQYNQDGSVTVTNPLGKRTTYTFQTLINARGSAGVKRVTSIKGEPSPNCPSSNSTFTYDERGLLKTKTDNKGYLTTYDYNARGLEVSRTEASGTSQARVIATEWHPDFFLPIKVTEPDRITQYTYDSQGRQTSQSVTQR